ncbi:ABC-type transport auxiliary lipoprotein family protein [Pseudohongiella nitratireducens]|uniref:ABC-type transport auxiliary lipoprotein family protein n=1 Tax=Pseudohongiella nitratireducens TaxID=1768907 RepID=UPI0030EF760C|tara:strand:- start:3713 stop:4306 length:594 start_codon:yes stop_codon:yes gene_type:complete
MMYRSGLILLAVLLSSCSVLPEPQSVRLFTLEPANWNTRPATPEHDGGLRIVRPETSDMLATSTLLIQDSELSFQAFGGARWQSDIPSLWREWLLNMFWEDQRIAGISSDSDGLQADRELNSRLSAFHVKSDQQPWLAIIQLDTMLVDTSTRRIIASRRFRAEAPLSGNSAEDAAEALSQASKEIAPALTQWVADSY